MALNKEACGTLGPRVRLAILLSAKAAAATNWGMVCRSSGAEESKTGRIFTGLVNWSALCFIWPIMHSLKICSDSIPSPVNSHFFPIAIKTGVNNFSQVQITPRA